MLEKIKDALFFTAVVLITVSIGLLVSAGIHSYQDRFQSYLVSYCFDQHGYGMMQIKLRPNVSMKELQEAIQEEAEIEKLIITSINKFAPLR